MKDQLAKAPEEILRRAVYGMLPKNNLRKVRARTKEDLPDSAAALLHTDTCCDPRSTGSGVLQPVEGSRGKEACASELSLALSRAAGYGFVVFISSTAAL